MRIFQVKVVGQVYEVEVEEVSHGGTPIIKNVRGVAPADLGGANLAPAIDLPETCSAPQIGGSGVQGQAISSPMPGKIQSIAVKLGQRVQEGDLILILEAMKMDNEIFSSVSGTVKEIRVTPGASVNPGDAMVIIE